MTRHALPLTLATALLALACLPAQPDQAPPHRSDAVVVLEALGADDGPAAAPARARPALPAMRH